MKLQSIAQPTKTFVFRIAAFFLFCLCLTLLNPAAGQASVDLPPADENFPREVKIDMAKSKEAKNQPVRVMKIDGKAWFLPSPGGFTDIENAASHSDLPAWLHVAAFNLTERNVAYRADSDAIPPYSQAHIYIHSEQGMAEAFADYPQADRQLDDQQLAADLEKLLRGVTPIKKDLWASTASGQRNTQPYFWLTRSTSPYYWMIGENQRVLVRLTWVEGPLSDADQALRAKAAAERQKAEAEGRIADEIPGQPAGSMYPAIAASLVFPCNDSYVGMEVEFGPLESQADIYAAVYTLISWQRTFTSLNTPK